MSQYFEWLKSAKTSIFVPAATDFMRSLPDSLLVGTSVFALFTQSFPMGILVLAMLEFTLAHRLIGGAFAAVDSTNKAPPDNYMCLPGIPSPYQVSIVGNLTSQLAVPSGPMFFIAAVISYCLGSLMNFSEELKELGKKETQWNTRLPLGMVFGILVLSSYMIWRYVTSCDTGLNVLGSTIMGILIGVCILLIHDFLFGRFAINFLGIPILSDRAAEGRPLYVCAKNGT